jgi:hypothetical protein
MRAIVLSHTDGGVGIQADELARSLAKLVALDRHIQMKGPTPELLSAAQDCIHDLKHGLTAPAMFIDMLQQASATAAKASTTSLAPPSAA